MKVNLKNLFFVLPLVLVLMVACGPDVPPENPFDPKPDSELDTSVQFAMQFCEDTVLTALGQDYSETIYEQSGAIKLSREQLTAFVYNRIIKMSVGLHGMDDNAISSQYDSLKFWIRADLYGDNLWSQDFTGDIKLKDWNEIIMSPYFRITDPVRDLYIGYTIKANGLIIGCDGSQTPSEDGCWIYDCGKKKWIQYTERGNLSIKCVISGENMPQNDAALVAIKTADYVKTNKPYSFVATVENKALNPLNSFDIVVTDGVTEFFRKNIVLEKSLQRGEKHIFFVDDVKLTKEISGKLWYVVENVNGVEMDDNIDDNTITIKTYVADNFVDRVVLLENTTGDACSNCPAGHAYIDAAMKEVGEDKFVWVAHHAGYNAGMYTSNQSDSVASLFYNTQMSYAPGLMIDRTNLLSVGVTTSGAPGGPIFSVNEVASRGLLDEYFRLMQSNMSPIALNVEHTYDATSRKLSVTVKGDILVEDLPWRDRLAVGITLLEDSLKGTQAGVAGVYYHKHVCRDGLSSILGTLVGGDGNTFEFTASKTLRDKFVPENMTIVVWVANKPSNRSSCDDYYVYQAYKTKVIK